jgi:hypothetical protein
MRYRRCSKHAHGKKPTQLVTIWLCHAICISVLAGMQTIPTYSLLTASISIPITYTSASVFCPSPVSPSLNGTVTDLVYSSSGTVTNNVYSSSADVQPTPNACAPPNPSPGPATVTEDVYHPLESKEMEVNDLNGLENEMD